MTFVSASWGFDPQALTGDEIVGERMPERMSLGLDEPAHGEKTEAVVLAIGVDPLDALAQSIDGLTRLARHPFPPFLEAKGFFRPLLDPSRKRGRLDVLLFGRRRRIDADRTRDMSGERNDVFACGVAGVDQQPVGRPAVAAGERVDHQPRPAPTPSPAAALHSDHYPTL